MDKTAVFESIRKVREFAARHKQAPIALGVLVLGVLLMIILAKLRRPPQRVEKTALAPLVKVIQLNVQDIQMVVSGYGTVSPKVEVGIVPQVSGKIISVNPQFKPGGFVAAGKRLLKIDPRDYELVVQQAEAIVAEAVVNLDLEKAEAEVAIREWQQLNPGSEPASPLVLREPQIRQAQAKLESAKAQLAKAKLELERTELSLPIDVRIVSDSADLGQYVMSGQSLGSAYGMDSVEIELPLEDRDLAWFDIPDSSVKGDGQLVNGAAALVKSNFAGAEHIWQGHVVRTTGQVDRTSRLVSVVIEVPEPFDNSNGKPHLLPGTFVEVVIQGNVLEDAVAVPRDAVHNGSEVWVVEDNRLQIRTLDIVRKDKDFVYSISSLQNGAAIVVSSLDIVTEGMEVRVQSEDEAKPDVSEVVSTQ